MQRAGSLLHINIIASNVTNLDAWSLCIVCSVVNVFEFVTLLDVFRVGIFPCSGQRSSRTRSSSTFHDSISPVHPIQSDEERLGSSKVHCTCPRPIFGNQYSKLTCPNQVFFFLPHLTERGQHESCASTEKAERRDSERKGTSFSLPPSLLCRYPLCSFLAFSSVTLLHVGLDDTTELYICIDTVSP